MIADLCLADDEPVKMGALDLAESKRMIELETVVRLGIHSFRAVGDALAEIRTSRLYKAEFSTFADYCRVKWQLGEARVYQLISAARIVKSLEKSSTNVEVLPTTESQARELTKVPPEKRAAVMNAAGQAAKEKGKTVTAKDVHEAVFEILEPVPAMKPLTSTTTKVPRKAAGSMPDDDIAAIMEAAKCEFRKIQDPAKHPNWREHFDDLREHLDFWRETLELVERQAAEQVARLALKEAV